VKITDVRMTAFRPDLPGDESELLIKGQSIKPYVCDLLAVEILTDEGVSGEVISGYGGPSLAICIADRIRPHLIGLDPADREGIWQKLWRLDRLLFTTQFAIGTIDVALWDLYAKSVGRPVNELLGGRKSKLPAYASGMTHEQVEKFAEEAVAHKEMGYQAYKIHAAGEAKFDIDVCHAVRTAVGDDYPVMIDVAGAYNQYDALVVGRVCEQLGFKWYEEPLRDFDIHGYRRLADKLDIPICGVEVIPGSLYTTPEYIVTRAVDIVRSDVSFKAGIGPVRKTAALAEAFGLNIELHANGNPFLEMANLQVATSLHNTTYFEQLVPKRLFDLGTREPVHIDSEGFAHIPDAPGIGVEIDWELVEKSKIGVF
jgi:L-alanine-DL-glutamate epimerase-like enolase superfamily enzyme